MRMRGGQQGKVCSSETPDGRHRALHLRELQPEPEEGGWAAPGLVRPRVRARLTARPGPGVPAAR